jgi:DNA-binding LacI/PurR family transcriptional regulator
MESVARLLDRGGEPPGALFCVNDPVAMGALVLLKRRGIPVPGRIALVGFTDNPMAEMIEPPLTTVRQPAYEIGKVAAELLIDQIRDKALRGKAVHKVLKTELIVRQSA